MIRSFKSAHAFLLLSLSWAAALLIVNPLGNYPLNDDWAYAQIVKRFLETGVYDLGFWPGMTLFTHVMWGSLFCKLFGFSFTVLRCATLALAIGGTVALLVIVQSMTTDRSWQRFSVWSLAFNPFFFSLSFSFMTDVPFLTLSLLALYFFKQAFEQDRLIYWGAAVACCMFAVLTRQLALIPALAFGAALLLKRIQLKELAMTLVLIGGTALTLYAYTSYMEATVGLPPPFGRAGSLSSRLHPAFILQRIGSRGGIHLFYWSIFLLPLIVLRGFPLRPKRADLVLLLSASVLTVYLYAESWALIPIGNLFQLNGLGPFTFQDELKKVSVFGIAGGPGWNILKGIAMPASALLLYQLGRKAWNFLLHWRGRTSTGMWKLGLGLSLSGYSLFLLIGYHEFDRYFLPVYPLLILLLTPRDEGLPGNKFQQILAGLVLLAMCLFSVIATRDYLSWQGARWAVLSELVEQEKISPHRIDGGFEFNGWYETGPANPGGKHGKSWWFVDEDEYTVAQEKFGCYEVVKKFPTYTVLKPLRDSLLLLKKSALPRRDTLFCDLETLSSDAGYAYAQQGDYRFSTGGRLDSARARSGKYSVLLSPDHPFGLSIKLGAVQPCEQLTLTAWRLGDGRSAGIVARAPDAEVFHEFECVFTDQENEKGWKRLRHELTLPPDYPSDTLLVYLWNPVNDSIWMDDLRIVRRRE